MSGPPLITLVQAALYSQVFDDPGPAGQLARFVFQDLRATEFCDDWDGIAAAAVGGLRAEAGRDPTTAGSPI